MDVTKTQCQQDSRTDVVTIAAISVVTLFLESVSHHGFGHGGAFLVMGARLKRLSSLLVSADATGLAPCFCGGFWRGWCYCVNVFWLASLRGHAWFARGFFPLSGD